MALGLTGTDGTGTKMTRYYTGFAKLSRKFEELLLTRKANIIEALEASAKLLEEKAKEKFGVYQNGIGNYPKWLQLAASTQKERVEKGYTPNDPLLRSGALKETIRHSVDPITLTATVGSTSEIMVDQEMGTSRIPPRPVLGPTAYENSPEVIYLLEKATLKQFGIHPHKKDELRL